MLPRGILAGLVATIALSVIMIMKAMMDVMPAFNIISPMDTMATLVLHIVFGAVLGYTYSKLAMQEQVATATWR